MGNSSSTEEDRLIDRFTRRETERERRARIARKTVRPEALATLRRALGLEG